MTLDSNNIISHIIVIITALSVDVAILYFIKLWF